MTNRPPFGCRHRLAAEPRAEKISLSLHPSTEGHRPSGPVSALDLDFLIDHGALYEVAKRPHG